MAFSAFVFFAASSICFFRSRIVSSRGIGGPGGGMAAGSSPGSFAGRPAAPARAVPPAAPVPPRLGTLSTSSSGRESATISRGTSKPRYRSPCPMALSRRASRRCSNSPAGASKTSKSVTPWPGASRSGVSRRAGSENFAFGTSGRGCFVESTNTTGGDPALAGVWFQDK